MQDTPSEISEPANLKLLRRLVTTLMAVMILGFVVLIGLFVMRFSGPSETAPVWPAEITAPDGATIIGLSKTPEFYAVITDQNQILIYDLNHTLTQTIELTKN